MHILALPKLCGVTERRRALVVQWTELRRPKAKMGVRFFPRAHGWGGRVVTI